MVKFHFYAPCGGRQEGQQCWCYCWCGGGDSLSSVAPPTQQKQQEWSSKKENKKTKSKNSNKGMKMGTTTITKSSTKLHLVLLWIASLLLSLQVIRLSIKNTSTTNRIILTELQRLDSSILPTTTATASAASSFSSTTEKQFSSEDTKNAVVVAAPLHIPPAKAPWDPVWTRGGSARLQDLCIHEIETYCNQTLPLLECLEDEYSRQQQQTSNNNNDNFSKACIHALQPCQVNAKYADDCKKEQRSFRNIFNTNVQESTELLLQKIQLAAKECNTTFWLTAGSMIGSLIHHGRIPWDDDIDLYIFRKDLQSFFTCLLKQNVHYKDPRAKYPDSRNSVYKLYLDRNLFKPVNYDPGKDYTWPSLDLFPVHCSKDDDDAAMVLADANHNKNTIIINKTRDHYQDYCHERDLLQRAEPILYRKDWLFPLSARPFGRLSLPFPGEINKIVMARYGSHVATQCVKGKYDHAKDVFLPRSGMSKNCRDLHFMPAAAVEMDRHHNHNEEKLVLASSSSSHANDNYKVAVIPHKVIAWPEYPEYTVEHFQDDTTILQSVIFYKNQEVRRTYADGLLRVENHAISYTLPKYDSSFQDEVAGGGAAPLVPFLPSEQRAYLRNFAQRPAEVLNQEVLPMLNRVQVSNKYYHNDHLQQQQQQQQHEGQNQNQLGFLRRQSSNDNDNVATTTAVANDDSASSNNMENDTTDIIIRVFIWNAERGTNWKVAADFCPPDDNGGVDIMILNEMDWGMARSGNVHTTALMADLYEMNYAYGVEFLELTNGNLQEINATVGLTNDMGYHGNVVMTRKDWKIVESKVLRLHPIYDHLYKAKDTGADAGEQRLGGRMALFVRVQTSDSTSVLVVSAHSHGGAKPTLLRQDADLICQEIKDFHSKSFGSTIEAVMIGGDMAGSLTGRLQSSCSEYLLPLTETNNYRSGGKRPVPTWRVECPDGGPPRARFERGDWFLAGGGGGKVSVVADSVKTIHPFRLQPDRKHECISDHSMLVGTLKIQR